VHGVAGRRFSALGHRFFVAVNAVFLDLAGAGFSKAHLAEERHEAHVGPPVLPFDVVPAALPLRNDVVFTQVFVTDGRLITGQNPVSSTSAAQALLKLIAVSELEPSTNSVRIEQKSYEMPPQAGLSVAHFLTVADIDRSLRF
jgi:hypothetical protein